MKPDNMERTRNAIEYILIFITAGVSIVIAVLDLAGLLDTIPWITQRIPTITLLGIGFVASYLILERRGKIDEIANSLKQQEANISNLVSTSFSDTIRALDGVEVKVYHEGYKFITDFQKRARTAKRIDDVTWGEDVPPTSGQELKVYKSYYDTMSKIASKPNVVWREIIMFVQRSRFERVKPFLQADLLGYSVKFYDAISTEMPPRMTFTIVDGEEVFLSSQNLRLTIRHLNIVDYFAQHYENLWQKSKSLKIGNKVNQGEINRLDSLL